MPRSAKNKAVRGKDRVEGIGSDSEESDVEVESEESEVEIEKDNVAENGKGKKGKDNKNKDAWSKGGWKIDPNDKHSYGAKLHMDDYKIKDELAYFLHFFPISYLRETIIPATNEFGMHDKEDFDPVTFQEFMKFIGLVYLVEVMKLPRRRMYWADLQHPVLPSVDFGKHMTRRRFEEILRYLSFSFDSNKDVQVQDLLNASNENLFNAISPGNIVTLDESMIKSFHHDLYGKIKIKRKPRPVGNEIKDMSDSRSKIVIRMELYEGKEVMAEKEHVDAYGATCATSIRLTDKIQGTGRIVIADSWFGSVKTAIALKERGLFSIMLVKTAHKRFPRAVLAGELEMGEWEAVTGTLDDIKLQAVSFQDLKKKQFISTCSTSLPGNRRKTKHHGDVSRPQVAETYLTHAASIDIHNHVRTGSMGLEDVLLTRSYHIRQFSGICGFLFTNAYLGYVYFKPDQSKLQHTNFKMALGAKLVQFQELYNVGLRKPVVSSTTEETCMVIGAHSIVKLSYPQPCYYCRHGYAQSERVCTTFKCGYCNIPLHKGSSSRKCWELHLTKGIPKKRRFRKI